MSYSKTAFLTSLHGIQDNLRRGEYGWGTRIRTWECQDQNLVPYRLAIPHPRMSSKFVNLRWLGYQDSNLGMPGSKPGALPLGDTPILNSITEKEMVREARLELAHLAAPEPKSGASTNFATPANMVAMTGFEPVTPTL